MKIQHPYTKNQFSAILYTLVACFKWHFDGSIIVFKCIFRYCNFQPLDCYVDWKRSSFRSYSIYPINQKVLQLYYVWPLKVVLSIFRNGFHFCDDYVTTAIYINWVITVNFQFKVAELIAILHSPRFLFNNQNSFVLLAITRTYYVAHYNINWFKLRLKIAYFWCIECNCNLF